jgi:hypothetical protein
MSARDVDRRIAIEKLDAAMGKAKKQELRRLSARELYALSVHSEYSVGALIEMERRLIAAGHQWSTGEEVTS